MVRAIAISRLRADAGMIGIIAARLGARFAGVWARIAVAAGVAVAILLLFLRVFYAGKKSARDEVAARNAMVLEEARDVASEIRTLDRAGVDQRLARWMRDDVRQ